MRYDRRAAFADCRSSRLSCVKGLPPCPSDEGGESGGPPVRVQSTLHCGLSFIVLAPTFSPL
jgi:hypothetical protein